MLWLLAGVLGGILVVHTAKSRFRRRVVSAAQFFKALPPPRKSSPKLSLSNPFKIPALYLRLLWVLLLLGAIWMANRTWDVGEQGQLGVWFLLDTSSSMTTRQTEGTAWEAAIETFGEVLAELATHSEGQSAYYRISLFDQALRDFGEGTLSDSPASTLIGIKPRSLATDLGLVRRALQKQEAEGGAINCAVVISDRPAPAWLAQFEQLKVVWRDISEPVVNIGIESLEPQRNPLTGRVSRVLVRLSAYGVATPEVSLAVGRPGSAGSTSLAVQWQENGFGNVRIETAEPGPYTVTLNVGGAYAGDDRAEFIIPPSQGIRVDWRFADRRLPDQLGWTVTAQAPRFQVVSKLDEVSAGIPTLWVGNGVVAKSTEVRDFVESSSLLADLNFDVVEQFQPRDEAPPPPFRSQLRDTDNHVWVGLARESKAIYLAGLPTGGDSPADRILVTLFFNSVRWLLESSSPQPIYTLTTPLQPDPKGSRLNLHPGEGDTADQPRSFGELSDLSGGSLQGQGEPVWPVWLTAAMLVLLLERLASMWGGSRWR